MSWEVKTDKGSESEHGSSGSNGKIGKYLPRVKFFCTFLGSKVNPLELFFSKMLRPGHGTKCHQINSAYHTLPFVNQLITLGYFSGSVSVRFYFSQPMLLYPIFGVFLPPANEVCECNVFTPVCQSFCSRGVCSSAWWDAPPCPHPLPEAGIPQGTRGRHPPGTRGRHHHPHPNPEAGTALGAVYAGRYGQQAGGTHSTGMHTCYVCFSCAVSLIKTIVNYCYWQFYWILFYSRNIRLDIFSDSEPEMSHTMPRAIIFKSDIKRWQSEKAGFDSIFTNEHQMLWMNKL